MNLNSVFSEYMNLNLVFLKSMNLNLKIKKQNEWIQLCSQVYFLYSKLNILLNNVEHLQKNTIC